ncbi:MAG: hypothetical protein M3Z25_06870 [Actinomycetota bacterium]|nr:hypothetical protein [Actinomycetota bacterium]
MATNERTIGGHADQEDPSPHHHWLALLDLESISHHRIGGQRQHPEHALLRNAALLAHLRVEPRRLLTAVPAKVGPGECQTNRW